MQAFVARFRDGDTVLRGDIVNVRDDSECENHRLVSSINNRLLGLSRPFRVFEEVTSRAGSIDFRISLRLGFLGDSFGVRSAHASHLFNVLDFGLGDRKSSGVEELLHKTETGSITLLSAEEEEDSVSRLKIEEDKTLSLPELSNMASIDWIDTLSQLLSRWCRRGIERESFFDEATFIEAFIVS